MSAETDSGLRAEATGSKDTGAKPMHRWMCWVLAQGAVFVVVMGLMLYLLNDQTKQGFAFFIPQPLSAMFLGANYMAVGITGFLASRQRTWSHGRIAVPCSFFFTAVTFLMTINSWGYFEKDRAISWIWAAIYLLVPIEMLIAWRAQNRLPGGEAPKQAPMPSWMRSVLRGQGLLMLAAAVEMYFQSVPRSVWPWNVMAGEYGAPMQPYMQIWFLSLTIGLFHASFEADLLRARPILASLPVLGALHLIAMASYAEVVKWNTPAAWAWIGLLLSLMLVGGIGVFKASKVSPLLARN